MQFASKSFVYVSGLFLGQCPSCLAKPPCLGQSRSLSTVFFFPFRRCAPFFSFPFSAIVRYLGDPAASVVDNFFPSAISPHSLLSTNAVVGRSYTGSIISIHIRLFDLNLSVNARWKRIGKALVRWFFVNTVVCSWSCLKTDKWVNCFTGI